jgi:hypothetical protein
MTGAEGPGAEELSTMDDVRHGRAADPATSGVFRGLAEIVYDSDDFAHIHEAVVRAAPALVDGCDHASLMIRHDGHVVTAASSDEVAATVDAFERELGEGPCLDALVDDPVFHDTDLLDGSPWPRLAERVLSETPVRGMAGFRIRLEDERTGALNLFSDTPGALTGRSVDQAIVLVSFVTVALIAAHERRSARTLRAGLESNREIGKAMGLLMAFHQIDDDEAFTMLRSTSQSMNLKLSEVARQVVEHHNQR